MGISEGIVAIVDVLAWPLAIIAIVFILTHEGRKRRKREAKAREEARNCDKNNCSIEDHMEK